MTREGDIAVVHFTGRIADGEDAGEVFDTTDADVAMETGIYHDHRDYEPLEFRVGERTVVAGLDDAVREMAVGDERTVTVEPERAFGERDESKVVRFPRTDLEERSDVTAEPGELVRSETGETGWIVEAGDETVTVDFNHELAGLPVEFDVKLLSRYDDG
ncbi:FKBP-type peptidyl-prolyl cis-trans isomerase [Halorussus gelatinilyticus]|uniref:Peptidyl-prolyl cis-trans isomerase n=1 Tax=Halorussus gelatinilyticus TaxID=2937524 RepID=A0A8U0IHB9_9EURY|nr:FKBP-type peptidyl-prolyl cis-trans isomerase [Halorussus gelatinilyticus]UPW00105.1 FKBP-type peptidyl-prolyl cis-trans isomerase [Halorussus gelatinilyticus]